MYGMYIYCKWKQKEMILFLRGYFGQQKHKKDLSIYICIKTLNTKDQKLIHTDVCI